ncbi:hypothetical protein AB0M23_13460 [Streptomyces sp. NPDC052077]|uniref:hypothetical protein n=1 Tax=Streptomyces sp. NPDC052077 TaxID=3154757 RepID=UPI00342AECA7
MPHHPTAPRRAAPAALAMALPLALALSACGGGDDGARGTGDARVSAQEAPPPASGGRPAQGESVTGAVVEAPGRVVYEVLVQRVEVGTPAAAAEAVADPADARGRVLAVAYVRYTHRSGPPLTGVAAVRDTTAVFADGVRGGLLAGAPESAPGCEDPYGVTGWGRGESHVLCAAYLVPADAGSIEVHWSDEGGSPFVWTFPQG